MGTHPAMRAFGGLIILTLLWLAAAFFVGGVRHMAGPPDETVDIAGPAVQAAAPEPTAAPADSGSTTAPAGDVTDGQTLFVRNCSACHGANATGGIGKDLVNSRFLAGLSDDEAVAFIAKGRPVDDPANTTGVAMPPKGGNPDLTEEQLGAIVEYLRFLAQ